MFQRRISNNWTSKRNSRNNMGQLVSNSKRLISVLSVCFVSVKPLNGYWRLVQYTLGKSSRRIPSTRGAVHEGNTIANSKPGKLLVF